MREAVFKKLPRLLHFYDWAYSFGVELFLGDGKKVIDQKTGTIQGNGLSSLLFDIGYSLPMEDALLSNQNIEAMADHDDSFFYGKPEDIKRFIKDISDNIQNIGLNLNLTKCKIFAQDIDTSGLPLEIERVNGFIVLGIPIGPSDYIDNFLDSKLQEVFHLTQLITNKLSAQYGIHLLKACVLTKGVYISRLMHPEVLQNFVTSFDRYIDKALAIMIQRQELSPLGKKIRVLPKDKGGLGIQSMLITNKVGFHTLGFVHGISVGKILGRILTIYLL